MLVSLLKACAVILILVEISFSMLLSAEMKLPLPAKMREVVHLL